MFARTSNQNRGNATVMAVVGLLMLTVGCATSSAKAPETPALSQVRVEAEGDATVVTLEGTASAVAQSFQENDPARVVVNLNGVTPGTAAGAIAVYDGLVDEVIISEGTDSTRVEIALGTIAGHELVPSEGTLAIRIARQDTATMGADDSIGSADVSDPWAMVEEAPETDAATSDEPGEVASREIASAIVSSAPATTLMSVSTEEAGSGVLVNLSGDGQISDATHFVLENPLRMVVDLAGLKSQAPAQTEVGGAIVQRIRVGQHSDKVRVVVDAATGATSFGETQVVTSATGMVVGLSGAVPTVDPMQLAEATSVDAESGSVQDRGVEADMIEPIEVAVNRIDETSAAMMDDSADVDSMAAAELPIAETLPVEDAMSLAETEPVPAAADDSSWGSTSAASAQTVYGVQLDATMTHDRVVIVTEGPADYGTLHPDAETLIVQLRGAKIDESATARITPVTPGVVSMVSAFDQPESASPEVRVVIQRAAGVEPTITQTGPMLVVDFPKGAHAAPIPVMTSATPSVVPTTLGVTEPGPAAIPATDGSIDMLAEGGLVDGKVYTGRRISLDFKDVDIDDVLRLVAEVSDLNVVAGDEVSGSVTIRLVDVPWDQALDVILLTKGLGFVRVGNVLRIAPSDQLKTEEEARLQERRAKEKLEDLVVKLQPVNYANVKDVSTMVKRLLTARGTVDIDQRTNTIILKDIAGVIDEATALIKAIDTQTPQVMIEAKIVEANLDFLREIGSTWAMGVQDRVDAFDPGGAQRTGSTNPSALGGEDFRFHSVPGLGSGTASNNFVVANPITQLATGAVNLGAFILDERFDVDVQLEAAESHGEGKVISSPRIVTLDNRAASIEQGVSIPFQTFENGDAKLEFIDAVLRLEVTPHITADRSIIMEIAVQRNAPDDSVPTPTGSPAIAKNEAETETLVKDGQTLVIGGIYVVRNSERESRVPYLHQIPVVGRAFKNKEKRDIRQELLVFVTPRIVVNPELGS